MTITTIVRKRERFLDYLLRISDASLAWTRFPLISIPITKTYFIRSVPFHTLDFAGARIVNSSSASCLPSIICADPCPTDRTRTLSSTYSA
jgi:hypothetical protein